MKKKSKPSPADNLEALVRELINRCLALKGLSEKTHFQAVDEALSVILEGVQMRLQELEDEDDE